MCHLAVMMYSCTHQNLFQLGCVTGNTLLCPPHRREMMFRYKIHHHCLDCEKIEWDRSTEHRLSVIDDRQAELAREYALGGYHPQVRQRLASDLEELDRVSEQQALRIRDARLTKLKMSIKLAKYHAMKDYCYKQAEEIGKNLGYHQLWEAQNTSISISSIRNNKRGVGSKGHNRDVEDDDSKRIMMVRRNRWKAEMQKFRKMEAGYCAKYQKIRAEGYENGLFKKEGKEGGPQDDGGGEGRKRGNWGGDDERWATTTAPINAQGEQQQVQKLQAQQAQQAEQTQMEIQERQVLQAQLARLTQYIRELEQPNMAKLARLGPQRVRVRLAQLKQLVQQVQEAQRIGLARLAQQQQRLQPHYVTNFNSYPTYGIAATPMGIRKNSPLRHSTTADTFGSNKTGANYEDPAANNNNNNKNNNSGDGGGDNLGIADQDSLL